MSTTSQQAYTVAYRFQTISAVDCQYISTWLNNWSKDGWVVISHAQDDEEYSFVLKRSVPVQEPSQE